MTKSSSRQPPATMTSVTLPPPPLHQPPLLTLQAPMTLPISSNDNTFFLDAHTVIALKIEQQWCIQLESKQCRALTKMKYTVVQLGATAILGCCKDYTYAISWVLVIKGTFWCESEMNRVLDYKHSVERVVKRLSCKVTEVESKVLNNN